MKDATIMRELNQVLYESSMSDEAFFHFASQMDDKRIERDKNGNILIMPPVGMESGNYESKVSYIINRWIFDGDGSGYAYGSNTGFTLPNSAVRSPDAAWIASEKYNALPENERQRFGHVSPDFVVEIRSPSDSLTVLKEKMEEYIQCGVRLGFLIDPSAEKAYIYKPETEVVVIADFTQKLSGGEIMPGFELPLSFFKP